MVVEGEVNEEVGGVEDVEGFAVDLLVGAKNSEREMEGFGGCEYAEFAVLNLRKGDKG